jgi:hypothetical protein
MAWGLTAALAAALAAASPFADKPCDSYSGAGLKWGDAPLTDFGPRPVVFDDAGVRPVRPAPAAGVHPRILCTPDDRDDVRRRLRETRCGQDVWRNILSWTNALRGVYDEKADYAQPDRWKGDYRGAHGRVRLWYYHDKDSPWNPANRCYARLIEGDRTVDTKTFWPVMTLEAFRDWVEDDGSAAAKLAQATITALRIDQAAREAEAQRKHSTLPPEQPVGGYNLSFIYDLCFNWLTPEQKAAMHDEIAAGSWSHDNYGTFTTATTTRSNWASFSYWLFEVLGIEGEPGFNDLKVAGMYRGWRNFLTYGYFPSGAIHEGEAKCQLGLEGIIAFAMRPQFRGLTGHPNVRAYATRFLPHSVAPIGDRPEGPGTTFGQQPFVKWDLLGGVGGIFPIDALGLKYMLPDDPVVDWVYRKAVGDDYQYLPIDCDMAGYYNKLLFFGLFASDFKPDNSDPGKLGLGNSYFAGDRGMMLTRSAWTPDALMLGMHTRGVSGGHPYADRNNLFVAGAGRVWVTINTWQAENYQQSVVVIDGKPQGLYVPARIVDYQDQPQATFMVGDAKYAWDWEWNRLDNKLAEAKAGTLKLPAGGWQPEPHSDNDFAFTKYPEAYLNEPEFFKPSWIGPVGSGNAFLRRPNYPVQRALRTAGLVRGKYPYVLVSDDIQKDDAVHHYDWQLLLDDGVTVAKTWTPGRWDPTNIQLFDVYLAGAQSLNTDPKDRDGIAKGEPLLLVRVLGRNQAKDVQPLGGTAYVAMDSTHRLVIPSDSVAPDYKVLLYPYKQGAPLPKTTWNDQHRVLTVVIGDQTDEIVFTPHPGGKTDLVVTRIGKAGRAELVALNQPVPPLTEAGIPVSER